MMAPRAQIQGLGRGLSVRRFSTQDFLLLRYSEWKKSGTGLAANILGRVGGAERQQHTKGSWE